MDKNLVKDICTCERENETSPALHSGDCPVWGVYHNLISVPTTEK